MATSDSEDFESADEDIEGDSSGLKLSAAVKLQPNGAEPTTTRECSTSDNNSAPSSNLSSGTACDDTGTFHSLKTDDVLGVEVDSKCVIKGDPKSVSKNDHSFDETAEEKSGVHESVSSQEVQDSVKQKPGRRQDRGKPTKTKESRSGPMKLGVRISSKASTAEDSKTPEPSVAPQSDPVNREEKVLSDTAESSTASLGSNSIFAKGSSSKADTEEVNEESSGWGFGKGLMGAGGLGSLGGWGSSLLNTATLSVSTLGSQVTQGISTVLETVEAGIGAPSPEELARRMKEEKEKVEELGAGPTDQKGEGDDGDTSELEMEAWGDWNDDGGDGGLVAGAGLLSLVSGVTQVTGKVFSTGLDTLEVIGKKTMEVLQEGDPGLKKKRALLLGDRDTVVLSQVLREAKEKAESEAKLAEEKEAARKAHFETLFDDYQGLVHLEALEMLSRQSDLRLKSSLLKETGPALRGLQLRLAAVQEMCEIPDCDESEDVPVLSEVISESLKVLSVEVSADKVIQCVKETHDRLGDMKADVGDNGVPKAEPKIIHQEAITALAMLTANSIEVFHKVTELLLVKDGKSREVKEESKALVGVTVALISEVNKIATDFSDFLSTKLNDESLTAADKEKVESFITSTFLEASNSSTYIQDAFQLMVPVLQMGAIA
ncbi:protein FAM114A2 [Ischnura elegans]|uniref:protein FAM114A2 n=1 Tax=Ischnura elegans TaxID=197161 RepID=UPI001ED8AB3E|nr:protein FAM114A2 [Ischnura elegans]